jgi:hypothetical protein
MVRLDVPESVKAAVLTSDDSVVAQSTPVIFAIVLLQEERVTVGPHPGRSPVGEDEHAACVTDVNGTHAKKMNITKLQYIRFIVSMILARPSLCWFHDHWLL